MSAGRPTKYSEEILEKARKYIKITQDKEEEKVVQESDKYKMYKTKVYVHLPTIEGLAIYLDITRDTIYDWEKHKDKKEFSYIVNKLRGEQAKRLIDKGLSGDYNPMIAKLLLNKHGYTERTELAGVKDQPLFPDAIPKDDSDK